MNTIVRFTLIALFAIISAGCVSSGGRRTAPPMSPEEAAAAQAEAEEYEMRYRKALQVRRDAMHRANEPGAQVVAATRAFVRQGEEVCGDFNGEQRVQMDSRASQDSGVGGHYSVRSNVGTRCGRKFGGNSE